MSPPSWRRGDVHKANPKRSGNRQPSAVGRDSEAIGGTARAVASDGVLLAAGRNVPGFHVHECDGDHAAAVGCEGHVAAQGKRRWPLRLRASRTKAAHDRYTFRYLASIGKNGAGRYS